LFDDFIKNKWQDMFRNDIDVRLESGGRYVPKGGPRGVRLLRDDVNAFDEALRLWSGPEPEPDSAAKGPDRIVEQAGCEYTWEWFLIDPSRPWADAVPDDVRERIKADLAERDKKALVVNGARAEEASRQASEADDEMIAYMNARRIEDGKEPLTEAQEASVRESRRSREERLGRT
jgi:hypothetical protein